VAAAIVLVGAGSVVSAHADPAPAPPPAPKTTIDADGTYAVGKDIAPGVYSSAGPVADGACYWKRTNGDKIVDNALSKRPQVIQIDSTDTSFTTRQCQSWSLTNAPLPPQPGPADLLGQLGTFIGPAILGGGGPPSAPASPAAPAAPAAPLPAEAPGPTP
jgi:hypothetical protein